jgi:hypothetical protein
MKRPTHVLAYFYADDADNAGPPTLAVAPLSAAPVALTWLLKNASSCADASTGIATWDFPAPDVPEADREYPSFWGALRRQTYAALAADVARAFQRWEGGGAGAASAATAADPFLAALHGQTCTFDAARLNVRWSASVDVCFSADMFGELDKRELLQLLRRLRPGETDALERYAAEMRWGRVWRQKMPGDLVADFDEMRENEDEEMDERSYCKFMNVGA